MDKDITVQNYTKKVLKKKKKKEICYLNLRVNNNCPAAWAVFLSLIRLGLCWVAIWLTHHWTLRVGLSLGRNMSGAREEEDDERARQRKLEEALEVKSLRRIVSAYLKYVFFIVDLDHILDCNRLSSLWTIYVYMRILVIKRVVFQSEYWVALWIM